MREKLYRIDTLATSRRRLAMSSEHWNNFNLFHSAFSVPSDFQFLVCEDIKSLYIYVEKSVEWMLMMRHEGEFYGSDSNN